MSFYFLYTPFPVSPKGGKNLESVNLFQNDIPPFPFPPGGKGLESVNLFQNDIPPFPFPPGGKGYIL